jgi:hypothetical protein
MAPNLDGPEVSDVSDDVETVDVTQATGSPFDPFSIDAVDVPKVAREDVEPTFKKPANFEKEPKTGAPSVVEWQDFIGRLVLRTMTDAYLHLAMRNLAGELTPREEASIRLSSDDLKMLAAPMATLVSKSKFAKKSGRSVVAATDSIEAIVALVIWMSRVNRVMRKHSVRTVKGTAVRKENNNVSAGQHLEQGEEPSVGGQQPYLFNPGSG